MKLIFALLAGFLTTLSPCVLPVLPFVTRSSLSKNSFGPLFLCLGLLVSFVGVSLLVSSTGYILGVDSSTGRKIAGSLLVMSGVLFLSPTLSDLVTSRLSFISNLGSNSKWSEQFGPWLSELFGGILLGVVWTPCSGPSLGAALGLAGQGEDLWTAAVILSAFGLGAIVPLLIIAYGARNTILKFNQKSAVISNIKKVFGVFVIFFGILIVSDLDRVLEAKLVGLMSESWLNLITKF